MADLAASSSPPHRQAPTSTHPRLLSAWLIWQRRPPLATTSRLQEPNEQSRHAWTRFLLISPLLSFHAPPEGRAEAKPRANVAPQSLDGIAARARHRATRQGYRAVTGSAQAGSAGHGVGAEISEQFNLKVELPVQPHVFVFAGDGHTLQVLYYIQRWIQISAQSSSFLLLH